MQKNKTLCLVDGSGYIFRAFYALPPMNRPDGTPVNAVYGFTNMMMNLIQENGCAHIVVIFDAKRQNFRNKIYPEYKANRRETPEELIPQFPLIRAACDALNVPWLEMEGYEADDLIATYAHLATQAGWHTTVISADKDLMQLMTDRVALYDPMKKKTLSVVDVQNKFGVTPDKVVDVQSLMGDSTDNIPGANGVGPKTAAELIQKYGSLHNLLDHLDEIPQAKRREGLIRDKEQILISEKLVSLDKNAPVNKDFSVFQAKPYDSQKLTSFLLQNGFQSLIKKVKATTSCAATPVVTEPTTIAYRAIQSESELREWLKQVKTKLSIAIKTAEKDKLSIEGIALASESGCACYIPLTLQTKSAIATDLFAAAEPAKADTPVLLSPLKTILEDKTILKIGHNIKNDWHLLTKLLGAFDLTPLADVELMSYNLDGMRHENTLESLAQLHLNQALPSLESVIGTGKAQIDFTALAPEKATAYMAERADMILRLYLILLEKIKTTKAFEIYQDIDAPLIPILYHMEENGILVDLPTLQQLDARFSERLNQLTQQIYTEANEEFNVNSPAQLGVILYEKRGLSGGKRGANGHWITDVKALENLAEQDDALAKLVLQYRSIAKLKSTYIDALIERAQKDPRIHTTFSLTSTNTGRLASSDPNLQNIPIRTDEGKEIRRVFVAKKGYKILSADYSQIELRLVAEVANVVKLKESFLNGEDIHARTASQVLHIPLEQVTPDQRRRAKAINFGIIYGISAFGLAANLGISRGEAKAYIDSYFTEYPEIKQYMTNTEQFVEANGYVSTPFGRKVYIPGLDNRATKSFALRAAINAPIQGGAADIIKMAMIRVDKALKQANLDATLLLQVHDELVLEVADKDVQTTAKLIKQAMEQVIGLSLPLIAEVGIGDNWKDAH
ncbi:MAG: DNA polymerase I [Alphaproteobacteria bacterium]|nr:DNA polymerase I [Alphaproteobacteria bacterium]